MLRSSLWRHLAIAVSNVLLMTMLLFLNVLPAHAQQVKQGPISVRDVYTTDENQNSKTVFSPGDKIDYHVDVDNNTGSQIPVDVEFDAFSPLYGPYTYNQTYHVAQMPTGLSRFYTPTSIPTSASSGEYIIRITVTPSNSASPANDGDWGEGRFTVQGSTQQAAAMQFCTRFLPHEACMIIVEEPNATPDQLQQAKQLLDGAGQLAHDAICNDPTGRGIVFGPNPEYAHAVCGS